jgi:D-tyrosyl-tRNA(Tyr) deacylase
LIGLLQRVSQASIVVEAQTIASIDLGLLAMIGIERGDGSVQVERMLERLLAYRVFLDQEGRMNLALQEVGGGLLLVPQITLTADTQKGNRPSLSRAAAPDLGRVLFEELVRLGQGVGVPVVAGRFGATMQVNLSNEGPVTFLLHVPPDS